MDVAVARLRVSAAERDIMYWAADARVALPPSARCITMFGLKPEDPAAVALVSVAWTRASIMRIIATGTTDPAGARAAPARRLVRGGVAQ